MTARHDVMARIETSRSALDRLVSSLSDADLQRADVGGWSITDHLVHVAGWERVLLFMLQRRSRFDAVGLTGGLAAGMELDALNEHIRTATRDRSPGAVRRLFADAHRELLAELELHSDEDLERPFSYFQPDTDPAEPHANQPFEGWVAGNTWEHYDEHRQAIEALLAGAGKAGEAPP